MKNQVKTWAWFFVAMTNAVGIHAKRKLRNKGGPKGPGHHGPKLATNNVKWLHSNGHVCLRNKAVQFVEYENDVISVQEIIGNKVYNYAMVNTDFLHKEAAEVGSDAIEGVDTKWIDDLVGWKYNCEVEHMSDETMNDLLDSPAVLVAEKDDGSSTWKAGAWTIQADENLVPTSLSHDNDGDDENFTLILTGMDKCDAPIKGCDIETEAGLSHVPYYGPTDKQIAAVLDASGIDHDEYYGSHNQTSRHLNAWVEFQNFATRTNWCGQGTPKSNPCPGDPSIDISGYDYSADRACRRHDHGKRFKVLFGFTRTECLNDRDLVLASNNLVIEAVYGRFGLASTYGCYGYGNYKCWKNWRYSCQCRGERIRYGSQRYEDNERNPAWGYYAPDQVCPDDLWSCESFNSCSTILEPKAPEGTC